MVYCDALLTRKPLQRTEQLLVCEVDITSLIGIHCTQETLTNLMRREPKYLIN